MGVKRQALLIGTQYKGLNGTENDVNAMYRVLTSQGFQITKCLNLDATRDGIQKAWKDLIESIHDADDAVVIYFSGHGGFLEAQPKAVMDAQGHGSKTLGGYQFLVPTDFDSSVDKGFPGLLDIEISQLLRDTTEKTRNVTVILDCCHAGRMAREPAYGGAMLPRNVELNKEDIRMYVETLWSSGKLQGDVGVEGNPHAVRIAASAPWESAWEYKNQNGLWVGAFTEALATVLEETVGREVPWKTTILRVCEIVNIRFPGQHPRVEGPDTRLHFSLEQNIRSAHLIRKEGKLTVIHTGRVGGAREGSIYSVMPFGSERVNSRSQIAEATIASVNGFRAEVDLNPAATIPKEGALAFPVEEALYRWPVAFPQEPPELRAAIENSKYLRCQDANTEILVNFRLMSDRLDVLTQHGVQVASSMKGDSATVEKWCGEAVKAAERLAKAQHIMSLRCECAEEALDHDIALQVYRVCSGRLEKVRCDGTDRLAEGEFICIHVQNNGSSVVYASVFSLNVAGKIVLVSNANPLGIKLSPGSYYTIGENEIGFIGLPVTWPEGVPKIQSVSDRLICILSSGEVDLRQLESENGPASDRGGPSKLEAMINGIVFGDGRDVTCEELDSSLKYQILHFGLLLIPGNSPVAEGSCR